MPARVATTVTGKRVQKVIAQEPDSLDFKAKHVEPFHTDLIGRDHDSNTSA